MEHEMEEREGAASDDLLLGFQVGQDSQSAQTSSIFLWNDGIASQSNETVYCGSGAELKEMEGSDFLPMEISMISSLKTYPSKEKAENSTASKDDALQLPNQYFHPFPVQQRAREGQKRWARTLQRLKSVWNSVVPGHDLQKKFEEQLKLCFTAKFKKQKEALLRYLQISAVRGFIKPNEFRKPAYKMNGEDENFAGWTGFSVMAQEADNFQQGLLDMFMDGTARRCCPPNTIHNMFRRANLIPSSQGQWKSAFEGENVAFVIARSAQKCRLPVVRIQAFIASSEINRHCCTLQEFVALSRQVDCKLANGIQCSDPTMMYDRILRATHWLWQPPTP
eukprot:638385-Hanusia_phi.AAC.1